MAASYSKLWRNRTPRTNGGCAAAAPEVGNEMWPSAADGVCDKDTKAGKNAHNRGTQRRTQRRRTWRRTARTRKTKRPRRRGNTEKVYSVRLRRRGRSMRGASVAAIALRYPDALQLLQLPEWCFSLCALCAFPLCPCRVPLQPSEGIAEHDL